MNGKFVVSKPPRIIGDKEGDDVSKEIEELRKHE